MINYKFVMKSKLVLDCEKIRFEIFLELKADLLLNQTIWGLIRLTVYVWQRACEMGFGLMP